MISCTSNYNNDMRRIKARTVDIIFNILNFSLLFDVYVSFFFPIFYIPFFIFVSHFLSYILHFYIFLLHSTFHVYLSLSFCFILFYYFWLGIGPKTALRLIKQHGRIEDIVAALMKVKWYEILFTSEKQFTQYYLLIFILKTFKLKKSTERKLTCQNYWNLVSRIRSTISHQIGK